MEKDAGGTTMDGRVASDWLARKPIGPTGRLTFHYLLLSSFEAPGRRTRVWDEIWNRYDRGENTLWKLEGIDIL
jgi:hypothetical protein